MLWGLGIGFRVLHDKYQHPASAGHGVWGVGFGALGWWSDIELDETLSGFLHRSCKDSGSRRVFYDFSCSKDDLNPQP